MVMLEAAAAAAPERIAAVATFDHGTGEPATRAAELAERRARELGFRVARERAGGRLRGEAGWRDARWRFLRRVARRVRATVATAHTMDDQVETVLMRAMRGAGARGLAGLYAPGDVARPLLALRRDEVAAYARATGVCWVDDPSNASRLHLRNRVRLDLLPALDRAAPWLRHELLAVSARAAEWRREVESFVAREVSHRVEAGELVVDRQSVARYDAPQLAVLWPALAARIGITLDRRGTRRLSLFTREGMAGGCIQLAGGHDVILHRDQLFLRRAPGSPSGRDSMAWDAQPLAGTVRVGRWRFGRAPAAPLEDRWTAALPADQALTVRAWRPGDRMVPAGSGTMRRVKGLLRDAGVAGPRRRGWPVVLADEEIVWIPGVRRSSAATARSGRPALTYVCERLDG
jgi:tRNA(Ile)-lysidine synthase